MTIAAVVVVLMSVLAAASGLLALAVTIRDSRRLNRTLDRICERIGRH